MKYLEKVRKKLKYIKSKYDINNIRICNKKISNSMISRFLSGYRDMSFKKFIYICDGLIKNNVLEEECEDLIQEYLNSVLESMDLKGIKSIKVKLNER